MYNNTHSVWLSVDRFVRAERESLRRKLGQDKVEVDLEKIFDRVAHDLRRQGNFIQFYDDIKGVKHDKFLMNRHVVKKIYLDYRAHQAREAKENRDAAREAREKWNIFVQTEHNGDEQAARQAEARRLQRESYEERIAEITKYLADSPNDQYWTERYNQTLKSCQVGLLELDEKEEADRLQKEADVPQA